MLQQDIYSSVPLPKKKKNRDRKYNKQQMVELFPSADSGITFPANPIDSIRLECCPNVRLASGRISCCGTSAGCAYMGTSVHRCTRTHTNTKKTVSKIHLQNSCSVPSYDILISYAATAKLALKVSYSKSPQEKVIAKCGATTHQVAPVIACEPVAITAG